VQVADRWPLLKNLGEALEYFFHQHARLLKQAAQVLNAQLSVPHTEGRPAPIEEGVAIE
jgi:hypothetical protein